MKPIVKPGTPEWVKAFAPGQGAPFLGHTLAAAAALLVAASVATLLISSGSVLGVMAGAALGATAVAALVAGLWAYPQAIVGPPDWRYGRTVLMGEGLALMQDIWTRFEYAERVMDELPDAFGPVDIDDEVHALLWEAAGHAARVTELDERLVGLQYARPGSPAAVLREELHASRTAHLQQMRAVQRQADDLASLAGDASAAAQVALERTGSAYELEIVTPGPAQTETATALDAAKERLRFASSVWSELDETTKIRRAALEQEQRPREG